MHNTIHNMRMNHPAVAVIRKFAQASIRNNQQLRVPLLDQPRRFLHNPVISEAG
ncbi:hypothetical protein D3C87_2052500 [compost metagenome]